jgi:CheY-like chemotaxis protein
MATRILFFGDHDMMANLYSLYLRSKGYEVLHFPLPSTCALVVQNRCTCPRDHVCSDLILADMEMKGMTGLELIRHQNERGCHLPPRNKAVLAMKFNAKQEQEIRELGCITLKKPFRLLDLVRWVSECEQNIPTDRKLTPHEELLEPAKDP